MFVWVFIGEKLIFKLEEKIILKGLELQILSIKMIIMMRFIILLYYFYNFYLIFIELGLGLYILYIGHI